MVEEGDRGGWALCRETTILLGRGRYHACTKQMDIWDEGQEPADPTLILFGGVVSPQ